jgi:hypothetical protein
MRKSNDDVWTFFPDARCGRNDSCRGDRYRHGVMYDVLFDDGQTTGNQIDLYWLLRASVHKLAVCISAIFLFPPFSLVKYMELLAKLSPTLSVFSGPA